MDRIIVDKISKKFELKSVKYKGALERVLSIFNIGEKEYISALKNINFKAKAGENIGIIGNNGSGKSTLLRLISEVYTPDEGNIKTDGKLVYLTGFGQGLMSKLTMRENIFLIGSIMGLSQKDIKKKFDEIVDFSGLRDFLDVKVYKFSSGMTMRLNFSIGLNCLKHQNPDILLLDEIFYAGDTNFKEKVKEKMEELIRGGATILFVSHDLGLIKKYCDKVIWLDKGRIMLEGNPLEVIENYNTFVKENSNTFVKENSNTFCPLLWNSIFINKKGDVYPCCHSKPKIIGNIYDKPLIKICNDDIILGLRKKSLNGNLECFKECSILNKTNIPSLNKNLLIDYSNLKHLKIMFGEKCNLDCIMCPYDSKNSLELDSKVLIKNVDVKPFRNVEILGGEPFFIKSAKEYFDYISSKGKKISLITNGTLITDKWAKKIVDNCSFIIFSLNAATKKTHEMINKGSNWENVLRNIKKIRKLKESTNSNCGIIGHMTLLKENLTEIPLYIKNFKKFGFDSINWGFDQKVPGYLASNPKLRESLKKKIQNELSKQKIPYKIDILRLKILKLVNYTI